MTGSGGITEVLPDLVERLGKDTGAEVLYDADSERLVARLLAHYQKRARGTVVRPEAA